MIKDRGITASNTMHRTVACFMLVPILFGLLSLPLSAQHEPPATSRTELRTGPEIDAYERLYFGLFPDITNFERALVRTLPDGAMEFVIARTGVSDTTLRINAPLADSLRVQLARHESYTLETWNHPLLRAGIVLPNDGWTPRDDAMVVRLSRTDDESHRLLCILDDTLAIIAPHTDTSDAVMDARVIPIRTITSAATLSRHSIWKGAAYGWVLGTATGFKLISDMGVSTNSGDRQMLADAFDSPVGVGLAIGMSQIFGLAAAGIGAIAVWLMPVRMEVDGLDHPRLVQHVLPTKLGTSFPPPPQLRGTLAAGAARSADSLARLAFDRDLGLHHTVTSIGTEGLQIGLDYPVHYFGTGSSLFWIPIGGHLQYAHPLARFDDGRTLLLRAAGGIGTSNFKEQKDYGNDLGISRDAYVDLALVYAPHPSTWFHAGLTYENVQCTLGSFGWTYGSHLAHDRFAERVFAGAGIGFRTGRYTDVDISLRISTRPVVIIHTYLFFPPSYPPPAPPPYPRHLVIIRTTFNVALWRW